jgi:putative hemolysin
MKSLAIVGMSALLSMVVGCAAESEPQAKTEKSPIGLANPASVYCEKLGFTLVGEQCVFPDGSSCEEWAFFRGECMAPPAPAPAPACTPLAQPVGTVNPASVYCESLGYTAEGEQCGFPDGTSCEEWAFYRGECGAAHSFCNRQGGTVTNKVEDMGGWTSSFAACTLPSGTQCKEQDFAATCTCN